MQAIDEIVPTLLHALEDDETSDTALDGLKQILRFLFFHKLNFNLFISRFFHFKFFFSLPALNRCLGKCSVRTAAVLPHILPKLVQPPLT